MTSHDAPRASSRRTVLRAAAWTAPAVAVVAAAPALAASTTLGTFTFSPGSTSIGRTTAEAEEYWRLQLGASLLASGPAIAAGALRLTIGFDATTGGSSADTVFIGDEAGIAGWSALTTTPADPEPSRTITYGAAVAAGGAVPVADRSGARPVESGTATVNPGAFTLTFDAPGYQQLVQRISTPLPPP